MTARPPAPARCDGALIGYVVPNDVLDLLVRIDPSPAIQTHRFGRVLLDLLSRGYDRFDSYGFAPVQDYPIARRIWFGSDRGYVGGQTLETMPFVNLMLLKHVTRFGALLARYGQLSRYGVAVIHGLHLPNLLFAQLLRRAGVRIVLVLTDPQGVILPTDGALRCGLKRIDRRLSRLLASRFDAVIALSPALSETYAPGRPALFLPGIYDETLERRVAEHRTSSRQDGMFRVVYFGGLTREYGIAALLDTLPLLAPNIEVRLFGRGELEGRIADATQRHPNLVWGGLVDQARLIREMVDCDLLINPRPAGGHVAGLSSPSKLIEFAASGRPVLTTRLPSLPPALLAAVLPIDDESPAGIAAAIHAAAAMDRTERDRLGARFQQQVRTDYSGDGLQAPLHRILRGESTSPD